MCRPKCIHALETDVTVLHNDNQFKTFIPFIQPFTPKDPHLDTSALLVQFLLFPQCFLLNQIIVYPFCPHF